MTTIKEVFRSDDWIITEVLRGFAGMVRINATRRFHRSDEHDFFCEWCTEKYANTLAVENYGMKISEFRTYKY